MANPECGTVKWSLASVPRDTLATVADVEADVAGELAAQGVYPGRIVKVLSDAPFGGPRVIQVGAARLAVARRVAARIALQLEPESRA